MFVISKQTGRTESLGTQTTCISSLNTRVFQCAGSISRLVPWIGHFSIIYLLYSYNLTRICEHPRIHIIQVSWQQITQHIIISLIINMFTFIYIVHQRAGQSSALSLTLSTFIIVTVSSDFVWSRSLVPDERKRCSPQWVAWWLSFFICCLVYKCSNYKYYLSSIASFPPWDGKMSTSQRAVMLCGWEGNLRPEGKYGCLPPGWWLKSPVGWLPVHWDQLRAQRSVTSMGSLLLFWHISCRNDSMQKWKDKWK